MTPNTSLAHVPHRHQAADVEDVLGRGIFLIHDDGKLVEMREEAYATEDVLQRLLADYPGLLAGDQIDASEPRKWLLLRREARIPAQEGGADRWAVDHLFVDQDAVPTLVEVKRSSDTRIRREVVGQMLDYAANAVVYWPVERLRTEFGTYYRDRGDDPDQRIVSALGAASEPTHSGNR